MSFKKKALWLMASARSSFCAAAEADFRTTFKHICRDVNPDIAVIYARVNAARKFTDDFNVHLNILQNETGIPLKCLKDRPDQTVDPHMLAKEFKAHVRLRDNKLGLGVLAIDCIHKLTSAQRNMLISFFEHNMFPFSVLFIIPEQEWEHWSNDDFRRSVKSMNASFKGMRDIGIFVKNNSDGVEFDKDGNFLRYTD